MGSLFFLFFLHLSMSFSNVGLLVYLFFSYFTFHLIFSLCHSLGSETISVHSEFQIFFQILFFYLFINAEARGSSEKRKDSGNLCYGH